jgi:glutamate dehydrogenase/leucine dehydrogenase
LVKKKILANTNKVLKYAKRKKLPPRDAAMELAIRRVRKAMEKRSKKEELVKKSEPSIEESEKGRVDS